MKIKTTLNIEGTQTSFTFEPPVDIEETDPEEIFYAFTDALEDAYSYDDTDIFNEFLKKWNVEENRMSLIPYDESKNWHDDTWGPFFRYTAKDETIKEIVMGCDDMVDDKVSVSIA